MKNNDHFSRVYIDRQSATDTSLALFSVINEWQRVPFLTGE